MDGQASGALLSGHLVILNASPRVRAVVDQVRRGDPGMSIVLVVQDEGLWNGHPDWHPSGMTPEQFRTVAGCPAEPEVLASAGLGAARAALILADPLHGVRADARSALLAVAVERISPKVHTVVELLLAAHASHVGRTEVNEVICFGEISEKLIARSCITPGSSRLFAHLLSTDHRTSQIFLPALPSALEGLTYRQIVLRAIGAAVPWIVCGYVRRSIRSPGVAQEGAAACAGSGLQETVVMNPRAGEDPGKDTALGPGDRLIVISSSTPDPSVLVGHDDRWAVPRPASEAAPVPPVEQASP